MTNSRIPTLLLSIALVQVVMLGVIWSHLSRLDSNNPAAASAESSIPNISRNLSGPVQDFTHEEDLAAVVRDVLRSELRDSLNEIQNSNQQRAVTSNQSVEKEPLTYEQRLLSESAVDESREIITHAVRSGVWTNEDSKKLYANLPDLTEGQRIQLLEQFHGAVNRQELELEDVPIL